jgi:hypothetical protein
MEKLIFFLAIILFSTTLSGQIDTVEGSAQVVSYWEKGEKQSYSIWHNKIKIKDGDTTQNLGVLYDIDVSIIGKTKESYLVEWHYKNFRTNASNDIKKAFVCIPEGMKVIFETDELGIIKNVRNWKDVSKYMANSIKGLRDDFNNHPELQEDFKLLESVYTTKQGIESIGTEDAQQYYSFHGGKYFLGKKVKTKTKVPNPFEPDNAMDATVMTTLAEIAPEDHNFIVEFEQEIDAEQLSTATFNYMSTTAKSLGKPEPSKADIGSPLHKIKISSLVHETGWLIYSSMEKSVKNEDGTYIEKRIIELK